MGGSSMVRHATRCDPSRPSSGASLCFGGMFSTGLEHLVFAKYSSIALSPRQRFAYVALPTDLVDRLSRVQSRVLLSAATKQDIDHITLVYVPKSAADLDHGQVDHAVDALREIGAATPPIDAKVQGWAYFDGAEKDGQPATALVALVDAPGLAELHIEAKSALARVGMRATTDHGFTPHITFGYLKQGGRVPDLPLIDGAFTIDKICFANADVQLARRGRPAQLTVARVRDAQSEHGGRQRGRRHHPQGARVLYRLGLHADARRQPFRMAGDGPARTAAGT